MTRHMHADLMIQAANDTTIEFERLSELSGEWQLAGKCGEFIFYPSGQYRQRPAPYPHQAMIDIAAADPSIQWQYKSLIDGDWCDCTVNRPSWQFAYQYRQKPAEVVMVDLWQWAIRYDSSSPIYAADTYYDNEFSVKNDRPGYEIVCRIEGSKISVEVSQ